MNIYGRNEATTGRIITPSCYHDADADADDVGGLFFLSCRYDADDAGSHREEPKKKGGDCWMPSLRCYPSQNSGFLISWMAALGNEQVDQIKASSVVNWHAPFQRHRNPIFTM